MTDKPSFDNFRVNKPGNGGEIMLYQKKLSLNRHLASSKCLSDHRMSPRNYDNPKKILIGGTQIKNYDKALTLKRTNGNFHEKLKKIQNTHVSLQSC